MNISAFIYGVTLNGAMLNIAESRLNNWISNIITIENKANFVSVPYDPHALYIFQPWILFAKRKGIFEKIGVYFERRGCGILSQRRLDYGGIKIYEYIKKRIFPELGGLI